ncbi:Arylsulfatase B like protein [Argiope bruennichi]|uniref:Arylsulfatase B like protein n=1 Tax=Argiope bruennichi TaxID=94029 RepID=A0A8T0FHK7_ARGBR|nr:Arylsulfatase B like protein [Argiope bruennichi]
MWQKQPHIIFTVADDLGWNDVSWHNPKIFTPHLEELARDAVILNQSYVQPVCTPSRAAFMTGYYPYRIGRQNHVLNPLVPTGVPLGLTFLPEKLKQVGYSTHLIGNSSLKQSKLPENLSKRPGMVTAMDAAIGIVVEALKDKGFWDNSIFIFTTDNGGQTLAGGNNWPLRGNKGTLWEGGTRAVTFIHGPQFKKGYVNDKLFHAVDWFPTLLHAAGVKSVSGIDGVDQWNVISEDAEAVRNEIVYNIYDSDSPRAAIRIDNYKLIEGFPGKPSDWIAPEDGSFTRSIHCRLKKNDTLENATEFLRLYDLEKDPLERYNIAKTFPWIVEKLKSRIEDLKVDMVPADDPPVDERGEPKLWGHSFSPGWCIAK